MSGYVKIFNYKIENRNRKYEFISLCIEDDDKLMKKYKIIWTKMGDLQK